MRALPTGFNRRRTDGATLLEVAIVVAVVATLAVLALPRFTAAREAARTSAVHQALLASLVTASTHAASAGTDVVACPGASAGCAGTHDWSGGWIVFADPDGDRTRDPMREPLLHRAAAAGGRTHLRTTIGRTRIVFQPDGSAAGSNATFTLCDGRGPQRAVALVMNNSGALRAMPATPASAQACATAL
ncbi:Type IV pilus assembly protein [Lysobacter dokdonensis DS-58]|uniref:Type II secretion system protein H n=1 Tax=Lysobacter dokdonensis DS-58 TaxID=1300345 RepID=A0A0A2WFU7_9GAMM|nr:GspH/FimT family protein [Lysobacter dokdonensis]KGQ18623.1 Type IV pilus assembly protein [Lysobacter dokdonensis DS-58]